VPVHIGVPAPDFDVNRQVRTVNIHAETLYVPQKMGAHLAVDLRGGKGEGFVRTLGRYLKRTRKGIPIFNQADRGLLDGLQVGFHPLRRAETQDRKSTRLNSSHVKISYAVF